jgi:hypothetical protein
MWSANRCRYSHGLKSARAFDTNALQPGHDFVGRLTRSLPLARPSEPSHPCRSAPVGSILRDADLLCALFEARGLATQVREDFASEMERTGNQNRIGFRPCES